MPQEHGLAGEKLRKGGAALLAGDAHVDHGGAQCRSLVDLHIARGVENEHRPGKCAGYGLDHGQFVVVDDGVVGVLVPGEHHDGRGVFFRQLLHGEPPPGIFAGGMAQRPGAVLVGKQGIGFDQRRSGEAVENADAAVEGEVRAGEHRAHLSRAEHGHRQGLRPGGTQGQRLVDIF